MGNYLQKKYLDEFKYIKSLKNMPDQYFLNGKKVRVINNKDYVKFIQSSYGGWDETMSECINQICTVVNVDHDKTIQLITPSKRQWLFNRAALEPLDFKDYDEIISFSIIENKNQNQKPGSDEYLSVLEKTVQPGEHLIKPDTPNKTKDRRQAPTLMKEFKVGDLLRVSSNEKLIQEKQQYCGGFSKMRMHDLIGKLVYVKHFSVRCVKVEKDGRDYDLHPDILDYPKSGSKELPPKKNSSNMEKNSLLFTAISENDTEKLLQIIDKDILDVQNNFGSTPINLACCLGEQDMVKFLLDFGADLNIADNSGNLPIHNCAIKGYDEIVKLILERFPDQINKLTQSGHSLLTIVKLKKNKELEQFLLTRNIDPINPISHSEILEFSLLYPPTTLTHNNDDIQDLQIRYPSNNISTSLMDPPKDEGIPNNLQIGQIPNNLQIGQIPNNLQIEQIPNNLQIGQIPNNLQIGQQFETIEVPPNPIFRQFETIEVPPNPIFRESLAYSSISSTRIPTSPENECSICRDNKVNVAFVKCGHVACRKCADRIFKCHICNSEIEGKFKIFI